MCTTYFQKKKKTPQKIYRWHFFTTVSNGTWQMSKPMILIVFVSIFRETILMIELTCINNRLWKMFEPRTSQLLFTVLHPIFSINKWNYSVFCFLFFQLFWTFWFTSLALVLQQQFLTVYICTLMSSVDPQTPLIYLVINSVWITWWPLTLAA